MAEIVYGYCSAVPGIFGDHVMSLVYKIVNADAWAKALEGGIFKGAAIDLKDGYIHFSAAGQAEETARLHFAGVTDLLLVAFETEVFGQDLKWEASRGGNLFPHVYATVDPTAAIWAKPMPWNGKSHDFPIDWRS